MRVAVDTNTATGARAPMAAMTRMRMPMGWRSGGGTSVAKALTGPAPIAARASGVAPMTATSASGAGRASGPISPTMVPMRSASRSAGRSAMRAASAGET